MSRVPSSSDLWRSPIQTQSDLQARQQAENEEAYRRTQEAQQQQNGSQHYYVDEPVDRDIYNKAVSVSSPRLASVEGEVDPNATMRKTIVRRVEVPFTRSVQVPTQVVRVVPTTVEQRVPVRKLVEVPGVQTVQEQYVEYEEREAVREKTVWVKKVVPERYIERVPVQKVRQVQKPTQVIREVETWEKVQVPSTKRVVVDGYRIDQVPDSRLVEVEEEQNFALRPEPVGPSEIRSTRDLGRLENPYSNLPDAPYGAQGTPGVAVGPQSFGSSNGFNRTANASTSSPQGRFGATGTIGAHTTSAFGQTAQVNPLTALRGLGLMVDETHTRHTDGTGVVVTRVERGGVAARAGLQVSDIITAVAGRPTTNVADFVTLLQRAPGSVNVSVNRDGRRNISLVITK